MQILLGATRAKALLRRMKALGWGRLFAAERPTPQAGEPWALDNGIFGAFKSGRAWDEQAFLSSLNAADRAVSSGRLAPPLFVVLPDRVADPASLAFSLSWLDRVGRLYAVPWFLVLQDGMTAAEVSAALVAHPEIAGLFLGGSDAFKLTARDWCLLAHGLGRRFHFARVSTPARLRAAHSMGADSCDTSQPLWSKACWLRFEKTAVSLGDAPALRSSPSLAGFGMVEPSGQVRLLNPARRGRLLRMASPRWLKLWIGSGFNPKVSERARVSSGAYAIRSSKTHVVAYVGESSRGTLWKTLLRHFQAPDSFRDVREAGIFTGDPRHYEVALHVTSKGHRPRAPAKGSKESKRLRELKRRGVKYTTAADQKALDKQAEWIAALRPTVNRDDGKAAAADVAREVREAQARLRAEAEDDPFGLRRNPGRRETGYHVLAWDGDHRTVQDFHGRFAGKSKHYEKTKTAILAWARAWMAANKSRTVGRVAPDKYGPHVSIEHVTRGVGSSFARWLGDGSGGWEPFSGEALSSGQKKPSAPLSPGDVAFMLAKKKSGKARETVLGALRVSVVEVRGPIVDVRVMSGTGARAGSLLSVSRPELYAANVPRENQAFRVVVESMWGKPAAASAVAPVSVAEAYDVELRATLDAEEARGRLAARARRWDLLRDLGSSVDTPAVALSAMADDQWSLLLEHEAAAYEARKSERIAAASASVAAPEFTAAEAKRLRSGLAAQEREDMRQIEAERAAGLRPGHVPLAGVALEDARARTAAGAEVAEQAAAARWASGMAAVEQARVSALRGDADAASVAAYAVRQWASVRPSAARLDEWDRIAAELSELERGASVKPAGYGEIGKAGQVRMFNPSKHRGALVQLGLMTRLHVARGGAPLLVLGWSLRDAPILAYDEAGRLVVGYRGPVVRAADPSELREYKRTHWGAVGQGKVRDCGAAPAPLVSWGRASGVTYATRKGGDRAVVDYVHVFGEGGSGPVVLPSVVRHECAGGCGPKCAAAGAISLVGGSYRVTSRGIVG